MTRLIELQNLISRNNQLYFYGGNPVPDHVYDGWKTELRTLSPEHPLLTEVGAPIPADNAGKEVRHRHPMGSLDNSSNPEQFSDWAAGHQAKMPEGEEMLFNLSFKADGCSVALFYKDGYLICAATRGDGITGEDITANAVRMKGVPYFVPNYPTQTKRGNLGGDAFGFTGSVRGEVVLSNEEWKALDPEELSNPRNLGNGIARRQSGEESERLEFLAFRLFNASGTPVDNSLLQLGDYNYDSESGMLETARLMGFTPVPHISGCTAKEVLEIYQLMQGVPVIREAGSRPCPWLVRDKLPFEIDGLVVKCEPLIYQTKWDAEGRNPVTMTAFKFPARGASTDLLDVEVSVGHTGAIIPTAKLKPVKIGGVTVSSALLCNWQEIERLGICIGDRVAVSRRGDVIPKVEGVAEQGVDRKPIPEPAHCPSCGGKTGRKNGGAVTYCLSRHCPAQALGKVTTWIKKLDIQGLGDVYIEALVKAGALTTPADLYKLERLPLTDWMYVGSPVLGESRARAILAEIDKKRKITLNQFLGSLGIEGLGRRRVQIVRQKDPGQFDTLEDWLGIKLAQRANEVGLPGTAADITARLMAAKPLIRDLLSAGVEIVEEQIMNEPQSTGGKVYCLTGKFPQPKAYYHEKITAAGHSHTDTYKKGISALVSANPEIESSKLKKARKEGVRVISAEQLLEELS